MSMYSCGIYDYEKAYYENGCLTITDGILEDEVFLYELENVDLGNDYVPQK
jgi:hypothetical protein